MTDRHPPGVTIRPAGARDHLGVMRVLDGGNLESDATTVERRIDRGMVLVAADDGRIIGALVAVPRPAGSDNEADETEEMAAERRASDERRPPGDPSDDVDADTTDAAAHGAHVEAVAVRLRRRGQGIGTALMREAGDRWRPLTADFYPGLSGFYEKLDFDIEKRDGQYHGVLD